MSKAYTAESINREAYDFMMGRTKLHFSFETSLGMVFCNAYLVDDEFILDGKREMVKRVNIDVVKGQQYLEALFDGYPLAYKRGWIQIGFSDGFYGSPEYKIKIL